MPDDASFAQPERECAKCGAAMEFVAYLPRFGQTPAYRFFECPLCKTMISEPEKIS